MSDEKESDKKKTPPSLPQSKTSNLKTSNPTHPPPLFEPASDRVSQSFLDLLNAESDKMSAALQNPDNWPGIQRAAREAPAAITVLEEQMGIYLKGKVGHGEAIARDEAERTLGHPLPDAPLVSLPKVRRGANVPWWKRVLRRIARTLSASLFSVAVAAPIPNMQAQKCMMRIDGSVIEVRCDTFPVCPPGWHLDIWWAYAPRESDVLIPALFGYGDSKLVRDTCQPGTSGHMPARSVEVVP